MSCDLVVELYCVPRSTKSAKGDLPTDIQVISLKAIEM